MMITSTSAAANDHWTGPPAGPREMLNAERVQAWLRPRACPKLETLEFAGECLPGRAVGGDFYDFVPAAPGWLALILGDVSGHGVPAALMMAALQASLRAHYALSPMGLERRIESVNRLFHACTAAEHYAGLFLGEYHDGSGRLRYANCGHVAPLLARADGEIQWLESTGTPLGLFATWNGAVGEISLAAGDTLVMATDGIVEAVDPGQGEFGRLRLLSSVLSAKHLGPVGLIRAIGRDVRLACGKRPIDDATIVAACARKGAPRAEGTK